MIIGHKHILDFLEKSIKNKRLAHAYIFSGSSHLGKYTVALEFIKMLIGEDVTKVIHPDVLIIKPEIIETDKGIKKESEISIKEARKIKHQMSLFPYRADYKIVLIDNVDKMTNEASNCLLKTLEEPSGNAILILISSNPKTLLQTIISRCQVINFSNVSSVEIEKKLKKIPDSIIRLANGRPGLAIQYLENPNILKEHNEIINQLEKLLRADIGERYEYVEKISKDVSASRQVLNYWLFWFRDLFLLANECPELTIYSDTKKYKGCYSLLKLKKIIETIKKTDLLLANSSINARLALEVLMLEI